MVHNFFTVKRHINSLFFNYIRCCFLKMHCSVLAEEAIRAAIKDYYDKNGIAYDKADFPDPHDEEEHFTEED